MATLYPVAGCKLFIGGVLAPKSTAFIASDFTSQTWVEIKGWSAMGGLGDTAQMITTSLIGEGRDHKTKGTANAGSMVNRFAVMGEDPGQIAIIAAASPANRNSHAFKVELADKPVGVSATNSLRLFIGLVMGAEEQGGEANTQQFLQSTVEVNSNIVRVAADDGV